MTEKQKKGMKLLKEYGTIAYETDEYFLIDIPSYADEEEIRKIGDKYFFGCDIVEEQIGEFDFDETIYEWEFSLSEDNKIW